jgi:hypothetical protein
MRRSLPDPQGLRTKRLAATIPVSSGFLAVGHVASATLGRECHGLEYSETEMQL